ncbi:flippase [Thermococcus sp. LS2]|uniref:flippase n=1 Tax=Thermococcus sp. LS2 TaxID=1638260 RepID=UPI00143ADBDA|nr:flippase [Thermococcus sp. LS2]NJE12853.1 flippase [Thermococcus sp. LS2]
MSEASQALQKIVKGAGIVFVGTVISMILHFLIRIIIARYYSTSEYGIFSLTLTVLNVSLLISTLGLQHALPREIAFYKQKRQLSRVKEIITAALTLGIIWSVLITVILIFSSDSIAQIFHEERLNFTLKLGSFALPFFTLTWIIVSISRGFEKVDEQFYFQNIIYPLIFLFLIIISLFFKFSLAAMLVSYAIAHVITSLTLAFRASKRNILYFNLSYLNKETGKALFRFSIPLMLTGILNFVMNWTDTLMLGYYKSSEIVGLYNVASPLAKLILIFLNSVAFLYAPVATSLYSKGKEELERTYQLLTKWIFIITLPIFVIMFLFSETIVAFFFGTKYLPASYALRILSLGFMFRVVLGSNDVSLIIIREARLNMIGDVLGTILNIILNGILIPIFGITGAAIATAFSYSIASIFRSICLYKKAKVQPFTLPYIKSLIIGIILILGLYLNITPKIYPISYMLLILGIFLLFYSILMSLSKSFDKEEIRIFLRLE